MNIWDVPVFGAPVGPLILWSVVTAVVYTGCRWVFLRTRVSVLHPGATAIFVMAAILEFMPRRFGEFVTATQWINWMLGPSVVAMAVPIFQLRRTVRAFSGTLAVVVPLGMAFAVGSTTGLLTLFGRTRPVVAAGALKSITSPVSLRLALDAGVPVKATLAGVLMAGMIGATLGPLVLRWMGVRDPRAIGLALGASAHGYGVARAIELGRAEGAFASIAMSGSAMIGALVLPYLLRWLAGSH